jgi:hypothetical protein
MSELRQKYEVLKESDPEKYITIFRNECNYLYTKFPGIFEKVVSQNMNLEIFEQIVLILKMIEDDKIDQAEGSGLVGKLSQDLFFRPVLETNMAPSQGEAPAVEMSWKYYKTHKK